MKINKIVVIPSDPLDAYLKNGLSPEYIQNYYNPSGYYDEIYALSPFEKGRTKRFGMTVIGAAPAQFKGIIQEIAPDIVRAYDGFKCADWAAASKVQNIPVVCSVHDSADALIHQSLKYADVVICMSEIVRQQVLKKVKNIDCGKVVVMPNRIDTAEFYKRYDAEIFQKLNRQFPFRYHILHVGRKSEEKNLDTLIQALKFLPADYCAIFVGRGDTGRFEEMAQKANVDERCRFVEAVPNHELPLWYSWCDCMCTPSRREGFGFVFIEAAACECAVVTSDIAPMNEYFENGISAYLVQDYENPIMLAETIRRACEGQQEKDTIKKNARQVGCAFDKAKVDEQEISIMEGTVYHDDRNVFVIRLMGKLSMLKDKLGKRIGRR